MNRSTPSMVRRLFPVGAVSVDTVAHQIGGDESEYQFGTFQHDIQMAWNTQPI